MGRNSILIDGFISCLKDWKMISNGCIYHIVRVRDVESETHIFELILVVKVLLKIFPNALPGIPSKREIKSRINLLLVTQPISVSPYRMAPVEFKEIKD